MIKFFGADAGLFLLGHVHLNQEKMLLLMDFKECGYISVY